jgi:hypothetical protein
MWRVCLSFQRLMGVLNIYRVCYEITTYTSYYSWGYWLSKWWSLKQQYSCKLQHCWIKNNNQERIDNHSVSKELYKKKAQYLKMIYTFQFLLAIIFMLCIVSNAFNMPHSRHSIMMKPLRMALGGGKANHLRVGIFGGQMHVLYESCWCLFNE